MKTAPRGRKALLARKAALLRPIVASLSGTEGAPPLIWHPPREVAFTERFEEWMLTGKHEKISPCPRRTDGRFERV